MPAARNVLFITLDQWRGDCLSALGHPLLQTPTLDALAARGVLFANHWANAAPCGPSRACLYTGTYQHRNRSLLNGTPLDARFTNVALIARAMGYDPVLFGYTDTSIDPRTVPPGDPRLFSYEGVLPGFRALIEDPWEQGSPGLGALAGRARVRRAGQPARPLRADGRFSRRRRATVRPGRPPASRSSCRRPPSSARPWSTTSSSTGTSPSSCTPPSSGPTRPGATRSATTTSTRPRTSVPSPVGPPPRRRRPSIPSPPWSRRGIPVISAPHDEGERRQVRATYYGAQREVDDGLAPLFSYLESSGLADSTLVVLTSDHGEMGGDHWLLEKLGYWDESYHVPLIVVDPRRSADRTRGRVVDAVTESVDVLPTICDYIGAEVPLQADGWSLAPFLETGAPPEHWRDTAHFEWAFSDPVNRYAEQAFGLPMSHCSLAVSRGPRHKYVQFGAAADLLPPLLFDLDEDPGQTHNLLAGRASAGRNGNGQPRRSRRDPRCSTRPGRPPRSCCSGTCARPSAR